MYTASIILTTMGWSQILTAMGTFALLIGTLEKAKCAFVFVVAFRAGYFYIVFL